jgi:hypothetical protein
MKYAAVLILLLTVSASRTPEAAPECAISKLAPRVSQAPLRYIRFSAVIENRGGGEVALVDEGGVMTSSLVQPGARTTQVEWKNVVLGPGEYGIVLAAGKCTARDHLTVAGGEP